MYDSYFSDYSCLFNILVISVSSLFFFFLQKDVKVLCDIGHIKQVSSMFGFVISYMFL